MAQGFKARKSASSSTKAPIKAGAPKKGLRAIAPKRPAAVAVQRRKEKVSKSATGDIEKLMVNRADGKLSIMKSLKDPEDTSGKSKGKGKAKDADIRASRKS